VINKIDLSSEEQINRAKRILQETGVKEVVCVSALTGEGITELRHKIASLAGGV